MVFNLVIAFLLLLLLLGLRKLFNQHKKKAAGTRSRVAKKGGNGLRLLTMAEYEANMRRTTEREKLKLFSSAEYKQVLEDKGSDILAWNW